MTWCERFSRTEMGNMTSQCPVGHCPAKTKTEKEKNKKNEEKKAIILNKKRRTHIPFRCIEKCTEKKND